MHRGAIAGRVDGKLAAHAPGNAGARVGAAAVNRYANRRLDHLIAQAMKPHQEAVMRLAEVPDLGVDSAQQIIAEVEAPGRYVLFGSGIDLLGGNLSRQG